MLKAGDYHNPGRPGRKDFLLLASRLGLIEKRVKRILDAFAADQKMVAELLNQSFLPPNAQRTYLAAYHRRRKRMG